METQPTNDAPATDTQAPVRSTTKMFAAVKAAHESPSMWPRYIIGFGLLLVGLGLYLLHVLTHKTGDATAAHEFQAMAVLFSVGFVTIPGVPEGAAAGVSSFGGALMSLYERFRKPKATP